MRRSWGATLIELMIAIAVLAVLATIGVSKYADYRERVRVSSAIQQLTAINAKVRAYIIDRDAPPNSLADIASAGDLDPWGQPYQYLNLEAAKGLGGARKNKNLVPINSQFDLYSKGKDGKTAAALTAAASRDDVIVANDGRFIGLASDYE